jgi:hypothetical protein
MSEPEWTTEKPSKPGWYWYWSKRDRLQIIAGRGETGMHDSSSCSIVSVSRSSLKSPWANSSVRWATSHLPRETYHSTRNSWYVLGRAIMSDLIGEKALIMVHPWPTSRDAVCSKASSAMRVLWWIRKLMTQTAPAALPKLR